MSGASATVGLSMQRAAMLALTPGAKAEDTILLDTGGTAAGAGAAVTQALKGAARIIVGPLFAEESRAAARAAGAVPVLSFSNDEALAGNGAFLLGITAGQSVTAILRYARGRGVKRVAVLGGSSRWAAQGVAAAERLRGAAGLDVIVLPAGTVAASLPALLRGVQPDALLVAEGGDALRAVARATAGSGLQLLGTQQALDLPPQDMAGAWLSGPNPDALSDFAGRYQGGTISAPGLIAALAYDAMTIVEMLRAGGVVDRNALLARPFPIVTGPIRFAADGSAQRELAVLVAGQDGYMLAGKSGSL
ncbi:ABC transporter substrate-binding protein [Rhizorhabdus dicambivorans]|nr:ABC transporter substrate-binding protein [Rhizorhabdus dicambivorans]